MKLLATATIVISCLCSGTLWADSYFDRQGNAPRIEVWVNKGDGATYYYGEDVAVYFRAESGCYVVVYDINASGEVFVLYPSNFYNSSFVRGGEIYRIPDYYDDFSLEVSGMSGTEHIYAVASYDYIEPPDFIRYVGYDYGDSRFYDNDYFIMTVGGNLDSFIERLNARLTAGPYSVAHTSFYVDSRYRHHRHYRYWGYDPYDVGSAWIGCDFVGAEVWIDGIYFGIAPVLVPEMVVGCHWVWIYYGGYPCYQSYFYIAPYERYYVNVQIDSRYKDYRYRRRSFGGWRFDEKKYRNESSFERRARLARQKKVRRKSLPSDVVRHFDEKGVISQRSPLLKEVRSASRGRYVDIGAKRWSEPLENSRETAKSRVREGQSDAPEKGDRKTLRSEQSKLYIPGVEDRHHRQGRKRAKVAEEVRREPKSGHREREVRVERAPRIEKPKVHKPGRTHGGNDSRRNRGFRKSSSVTRAANGWKSSRSNHRSGSSRGRR